MDDRHEGEGGSEPRASSRRRFIRRTASAAAGAAVLASTARSYARILGANDRIQIGQIGCSDRAFGLREMLKGTAGTFDSNFDLRSVCDIWSVNREKGASHAEKLFGRRPATYKYSEEMLADKELDAVMVATGDHQHARILAEVARAGKDAYCEKPMANTLADAKLARDAVRESGCIAQMGSQWLSCPYQQRVREIVRSGRLGRITKIEQSWNFNGPRWRLPRDPDIAAIREEDTDWERWLLGRPWRPFDPRIYFEFRIYEDFSKGITDQWYSHGSGLVHFYLDRFIPDDTVASGGIFAWHDGRENPDTFQCLSTFREEEVLYSYCSSYGNSHGDHTVIRGTRGTLYSRGEGSPAGTSSGDEERLALERGVRRGDDGRPEAGARHRTGPRGRGAAGQPGRQRQGTYRQLARVPAQPQDAQRQHRVRLRPLRGRGDGHPKLPRGEEALLGPGEGRDRGA
jgi:predicted dehydrogenase